MKINVYGLFCVCILSGFLRAQLPPDKPEIPRFKFSACAVGSDDAPELYWLDLSYDQYGQEIREPRRLSIPIGARGGTVDIPVKGPLKLYRQVVDDQGVTSLLPAIDLPEQEEDDRLVMMIVRRPDGGASWKFYDDSAEAHPAGTVRFINLSSGQAAASIGGNPQIIGPGQSKLLGRPNMNAENRFRFGVRANIPGRPTYKDPIKLLRFRSPKQRLLVLFTFLPRYETVVEGTGDNEIITSTLSGYDPMAYRLYDRIEPKDEKEKEEEAEE